jgi:hypothetical protein
MQLFVDSAAGHLYQLAISAAGVVISYLMLIAAAPHVAYAQRERDRSGL